MRDLIRQIVSAYQALSLEGQGEGYVLFSGQEPDTKRPIAIKILPRVLGPDPQIAARFRALAQTIRQLNHPNIATVREVGEKAGLPYIVTRVIERAQPLADRLNQPWAVDKATDIVMQAGQALEHAYGKGLVHGALSPKEILVQPNGRVAVTDFGLAQLLDLVGVQVRQAAAQPFIAPERAAGRPPDPRGDVYSLSAILYSLLTRRSVQVVQGQVLAPSRFNPEVPPAMDAVLIKGLALKPEDRYPDVRSFLAALGAVALVPAARPAPAPARPGPAASAWRCSRCGADNQGGQFCRRCGAHRQPTGPSRPGAGEAARPGRLSAPSPTIPKLQPETRSRLDEPIQITTISVGAVEVGKGVDMKETVIATPITVATGELVDLFPAPLEMPQVDLSGLAALSDSAAISVPEPPPMPVIDWEGIAPPMPAVPTVEDIPVKREAEQSAG